MKERGFYVVQDRFFDDFSDPYLKNNKGEHRPHYFAFQDRLTGLYWLIPMSSRAEKYEKIYEQKVQKYRRCDTLHICKLDNGVRNVFLIQDMFPIRETYIAGEYTLGEAQLMLTSEEEAKIVLQKSRRTLNMIRKGARFSPTQPDVLTIEKELISKAKDQQN